MVKIWEGLVMEYEKKTGQHYRWLMVKRWDVAVVEYGKNGTTLDVAYGQNEGLCGYGI